MDSALKQRLLGAAVLIALAIIFVPMIFSGSGPVQESATIDLEIPPAPDREFETRVMTVDADNRDPGATPVPARVPEPVVAVDAPSLPRPDADAEPAPVASPAPEAAAPTRSEPPAQAPVALAGVAANGNFLVHLGVYAATSNAVELVDTLKRAGMPAFAEATEFQGKPAQRVRVGPYATRAQAEATRIRVKQLKPDVPGSVVTRSTNATADAPASAVAPTRAGGWAVQLGAFKAESDANTLRARLRGAGFASYVDKLDAEQQTLWRVRAGPEADRANAEKLRDRIKEKLKVDGLIVTQ